jgi:hypothetical protein
MYQFKDNKSSVYYHEQNFTLQWNFPDARWVVVKYVNGNRRVILPIVTDSSKQIVDGSKYKLVNAFLWIFRKNTRKHRYKRLFIRNPIDEFTNISNFRSQHIKLYVIGSKFPWCKTVNVPMHVTLLRIEESNLNINVEELRLAHPTMTARGGSVEVNGSDVSIENSNFKAVIPDMNTQSDVEFICASLNQSINQLIASGMISEETNNESILQILN